MAMAEMLENLFTCRSSVLRRHEPWGKFLTDLRHAPVWPVVRCDTIVSVENTIQSVSVLTQASVPDLAARICATDLSWLVQSQYSCDT